MRIRSFVLLALSLVLASWLIGCNDRPASPPADAPVETTEAPEAETSSSVATAIDEEVVARVNGRPLNRARFESAKDSVLNQYAQMYSQFGMSVDSMMVGAEGRLFRLSLEAEALDRAMASVLIEEEADRRGIQPNEEDVEAEFEGQYAMFLESQGWTAGDFAARLAEEGSTFETFKATGLESIAWQLTLNAVRQAVAGPIEISDEELGVFFAERRADYSQPEQVKASHILVETAPEAEEVMAELAAGADFAELARDRSTCPSASAGGDLGWFGAGMMVPAFETAAFGLAPGEISEIVETDFGFHIILLTDHKDALEPELNDVIDQVRLDLEEEILNKRMQSWFDDVYDAAEFEVLLPLVAARRTQEEDIDLGIEAFERVRDEGMVQEPYLSYIIGSLYETKLASAQSEKVALEADSSDTPERAAEIEAIDAQIATYMDKAVAEYRRALEAVGTDASIQAKIDDLEAQQSTETESPAGS